MRKQKGFFFAGAITFAVGSMIMAVSFLIAILVLKVRILDTIIIEQKSDDAPLMLNVLLSSTNSTGYSGDYLAGMSIVTESDNLQASQAAQHWHKVLQRYNETGKKDCADVFYLKTGNSFQPSNYNYFIDGTSFYGKTCKKKYFVYTLLSVPYNNAEITKILVYTRD